MVTTYLFSSALPDGSSLRLAVMCGSEKRRSPTSSKCSPVMTTSTSVPTFPPMGMVVKSRGAGRPTDCPRRLEQIPNRIALKPDRRVILGEVIVMLIP